MFSHTETHSHSGTNFICLPTRAIFPFLCAMSKLVTFFRSGWHPVTVLLCYFYLKIDCGSTLLFMVTHITFVYVYILFFNKILLPPPLNLEWEPAGGYWLGGWVEKTCRCNHLNGITYRKREQGQSFLRNYAMFT